MRYGSDNEDTIFVLLVCVKKKSQSSKCRRELAARTRTEGRLLARPINHKLSWLRLELRIFQ